MKYCRNCGSQISETADFCTHCGVKVDKPTTVVKNQQKSSGTWKIVLIICITLIILSGIAFVGFVTYSVIKEIDIEETERNEWFNNWEEEINTYEKNDKVIEDDKRYVLKEIKQVSSIKDVLPENGHTFLIITIELTNLDDETISISPYQFVIENEYGNLYKVSSKKIPIENQLEMMTLKPQETVEKIMIYEIKTMDRYHYLNVYDEILDLDAEFRFKLFEDNNQGNAENTL